MFPDLPQYLRLEKAEVEFLNHDSTPSYLTGFSFSPASPSRIAVWQGGAHRMIA
jgi:hypothetical protein